jgi:hypothetical protein
MRREYSTITILSAFASMVIIASHFHLIYRYLFHRNKKKTPTYLPEKIAQFKKHGNRFISTAMLFQDCIFPTKNTWLQKREN